MIDHHRLIAYINTFLRAFGIAKLTADTFVRNIIPFRYFFRAAELKIGALHRLFGKIEPFARSLIQLEYAYSAARFLRGIDLNRLYNKCWGNISIELKKN